MKYWSPPGGEDDLLLLWHQFRQAAPHDIEHSDGLTKGPGDGAPVQVVRALPRRAIFRLATPSGGTVCVKAIRRHLPYGRPRLVAVAEKLHRLGWPVAENYGWVGAHLQRDWDYGGYWFTTWIAESRPLSYFFFHGAPPITEKRRHALLSAVGRHIGHLHRHRWVHGDCQFNNILVGLDDRLTFVDLDRAGHRSPWRRRTTDLRQLLDAVVRYALPPSAVDALRTAYFAVRGDRPRIRRQWERTLTHARRRTHPPVAIYADVVRRDLGDTRGVGEAPPLPPT